MPISASLSTQNLSFTPGTTPVSFTVTVNNDSNEFANFQIEITAAGEQRNPEYRWYKLEPEQSAAKPPGDSTDFQVLILDTPIPGFLGTVNLTISIFSPQIKESCRLLLRLKIERDNRPTSLSLELPVQQFQVYPANSVDIPVRVRNLGQQTTNVNLCFLGIDAAWLSDRTERRLSLTPGGYQEVSFQCTPPSIYQSPCEDYPFTIEATSNNGFPASIPGNLQVLPVGFVEFSVTNKERKIPQESQWLPDWKSDTGTFELVFKNKSNLYQEININIDSKDRGKYTYQTDPETAKLSLGETKTVHLNVTTKRPWLGLAKFLLLEAKPQLFDQRLGTTDPATQSLELRSLPIIPLWLQLTVLGLITLLLAFLFKPEPVMHTDSVNSVAFNGNGLSALSGSDDCTLRYWNINRNNNKIEPAKFSYQGQPNACNQLQKPNGLLAIPNDIIYVADFMPVDNNIVAVGLDNGVIELRNVPSGNKREELQDQQDKSAIGDRVFDLEFTQNSRYLFSAYGSGKIRLWSRTSANSLFQLEPTIIDIQNQFNFPFEARTLNLSPDNQTLVISGNYKRFLFGSFDPNQADSQVENLSVQTLPERGGTTGRNDYVWAVDFISVSTESSPKILATADSGGYIIIWDLDQCQPLNNDNNEDIENTITPVNCQLIDSWQVPSKMPVRTLKFSENGSLLVSGGDDGKVIVWYLTPDYKLDKTKTATGEIIYQSSEKINSVDLKDNIIISGADDFQVKLHRIK
jgi:WD40 repeat protein